MLRVTRLVITGRVIVTRVLLLGDRGYILLVVKVNLILELGRIFNDNKTPMSFHLQ